MQRERSNAVLPYNQDGTLDAHTEQIQQVINGVGQPVVLNIHLPAKPDEGTEAGATKRSVDWVALSVFGFPALVVIVISSLIFVGCMAQPPPPPPTVVQRSTPSCLFLC